MNWQLVPDKVGRDIKENQEFFVLFYAPLEQFTIVNSHMWVSIHAAATYFGKPGRMALATRQTEAGVERGCGTIEEGLELVKQMAAELDADIEAITKALRNFVEPLELMAFLADIPQRKCEPAPEIANRSKKPSLFRAFASRFRKAR